MGGPYTELIVERKQHKRSTFGFIFVNPHPIEGDNGTNS